MHGRRKWQPTPVLAWRIPGMGEPGGLPSVGSHRVGHDWSDAAAAAAAAAASVNNWGSWAFRKKNLLKFTCRLAAFWHYNLFLDHTLYCFVEVFGAVKCIISECSKLTLVCICDCSMRLPLITLSFTHPSLYFSPQDLEFKSLLQSFWSCSRGKIGWLAADRPSSFLFSFITQVFN